MNVSNRFKNTEIGRIPKEWEVVTLRNIVENDNDIVAGPFGSNLKVSDYRENGIPIIRLQNIERNEFIHKDIKYITNAKAEELGYHSFKTGDIVLAKLGDPIGKACIVPSSLEKGIVVADVVRIRVSPKRASTYFLEYVLNSPTCTVQLQKETIGTTRPRVNISQIRYLKIPLPTLPEQQKIAEILSTVDKGMEKVDEEIEKTQRLKRGLMQELLTKGIGHKEFKDTEIGRIPREWEVVKLNRIGMLKDGDWILKKYYTSTGVRLLQVGDIGTGKFLDKSKRFISYETARILNCTFLKPEEDILISRMPDPIGRACFAPKLPYSYIVAVDITIFRLSKSKAEPKFIVHVLNSYRILKEAERASSGATRLRISRKNLERLRIPIPPLQEQQKIAEILSTVDKRLELLREKKERLARVKKGLMNELLTGKKRVGRVKGV